MAFFVSLRPMKFKLTILFLIIYTVSFSQTQIWQIQGEFTGDSSGDYLGYDSRISGDGNTVIIGSASANSSEGYSRVFDWNGSVWTQKGNTFFGSVDALEGRELDINQDGSIVVTSAYAYDTPSYNGAGRVRVYQWDGSQWIQMGDSFYGNYNWALLGSAVSISNDGNTLAISEPGFSNSSTNGNGRIHIYSWNGTNWIEMNGSPIEGNSGTVDFGEDISLGHDGNSIIIGDRSFAPQGPIKGFAQIFEFNGQTWNQKGANILGTVNNGAFGCSVSISSDGNTVIVGAKDIAYGNGSGSATTYKWDGSNWNEVGAAIYDISQDQLGYAVEINDPGTAMIISSRGNYGKVYIYHWSGMDWVQIGQEVGSGNFADAFGITVDIDDSGYSFIVGASSSDQNGSNSGTSYVYEPDNLSVNSIGHNAKKELLQITDLMGRITNEQKNSLMIYTYSDGTRRKVFELE